MEKIMICLLLLCFWIGCTGERDGVSKADNTILEMTSPDDITELDQMDSKTVDERPKLTSDESSIESSGYERNSAENNPPTLGEIGDIEINEGEAVVFNLTANDPDADALIYRIQALPVGASFVGQTFTWTPGYEQAGTYQITFTVSAGQLQDSETVTITVNDVNR